MVVTLENGKKIKKALKNRWCCLVALSDLSVVVVRGKNIEAAFVIECGFFCFGAYLPDVSKSDHKSFSSICIVLGRVGTNLDTFLGNHYTS